MSRLINPWAEFRALLPESPTVVAEVIAVHADGTSTVEQLDGSQFRARGDGLAVGAFAFVRAQEIVGEAPAVTVEEAEV
jgi:hypothetical protein